MSNAEKLNEVRKIMGSDIMPLLEGATMIRDGILFFANKSKREEVIYVLFTFISSLNLIVAFF